MKRPKYRVVKDHKASFAYALVAVEGDEVYVGKEDQEMPGWFWCNNKNGVEMWVPSTHLMIRGKTGYLTQDYNSTELNAKAGEYVQVLSEILGWFECLNSEWKYGWIPESKCEILTF